MKNRSNRYQGCYVQRIGKKWPNSDEADFQKITDSHRCRLIGISPRSWGAVTNKSKISEYSFLSCRCLLVKTYLKTKLVAAFSVDSVANGSISF